MEFWRNDCTRLWKLTTQGEQEYLPGIAVDLVEFLVPEERDEQNFRHGFITVSGYVPNSLTALENLGRGETLQIQHGTCRDPKLYRLEDNILKFADCELESKVIPSPSVNRADEASSVTMEIRLRCWIEVLPDGGC